MFHISHRFPAMSTSDSDSARPTVGPRGKHLPERKSASFEKAIESLYIALPKSCLIAMSLTCLFACFGFSGEASDMWFSLF